MSLFTELKNYCPFDDEDKQIAQRFRAFLENSAEQSPYSREINGTGDERGHITGSAWIIDKARTHCVLLYHAKLKLWVQPGGHCDGQSDAFEVARREAKEETGLHLPPTNRGIFDLDIHRIPPYWNTPAHLHFDVRYLFITAGLEELIKNHESRGLRWVTLDEAVQLSGQKTVERMVQKTRKSAF